jgi:hypothetical protein
MGAEGRESACSRRVVLMTSINILGNLSCDNCLSISFGFLGRIGLDWRLGCTHAGVL